MPQSTTSCEESWRLPQLWAVFLLLLIAVTYRLWVPQAVIPPVPLLELPVNLPAFLTWSPLLILVASLLSVAFFPSRLNRCWWIVSASLAAAFLLDQHRLQPWAYQTAIYALVFASMKPAMARRLLIPLAISVYLFSGLGKLDYQFAHSVGQDLVDVAMRPLGGLPKDWSESSRAGVALLLPTIEVLTAIGLMFGRLRAVAGMIVIAMHLTLIAVLGPWGLDHSRGVLVWNSLLIVQAWFLFVRPPEYDRQEPIQPLSVAGSLAGIAVAIALFAPLLERSGYWDHWLSWALYSPHSSRVDVEIHRSALDSLDPPMRTFLEADHDGDGWQTLALNRWSLETLGVPVYPQARYQLSLVNEVAKRHQLGKGVRARVRGVADRWTGVRSEQLAIGQHELEEATKQFWLRW